jgi:hypothetical protein
MTESTNELKNEPVIRVTLDLAPNGVKSVVVRADTAEGRDEGLQRLNACLPQLELQAALQVTCRPDQSSLPAKDGFNARTQERYMSQTQEAIPTFNENLEKLCRIIEDAFHIGSITLFSIDKASMSDFPAYLGAIEKVSSAVCFEVQPGDLLVDIAARMQPLQGSKA